MIGILAPRTAQILAIENTVARETAARLSSRQVRALHEEDIARLNLPADVAPAINAHCRRHAPLRMLSTCAWCQTRNGAALPRHTPHLSTTRSDTPAPRKDH